MASHSKDQKYGEILSSPPSFPTLNHLRYLSNVPLAFCPPCYLHHLPPTRRAAHKEGCGKYWFLGREANTLTQKISVYQVHRSQQQAKKIKTAGSDEIMYLLHCSYNNSKLYIIMSMFRLFFFSPFSLFYILLQDADSISLHHLS